jgi:pyruvate formate lyase activating enzyme
MPDSYQLIETRLQTPLDNGDTVCNLCLWRCRLRHGQRGFCQSHVNRNGTLYNLSYGIISAIDVEAIENKPVYHYRPGSKVMSIGSYGCNFRCKGCHNLEISWGVEALDKLARGESTDAWVKPEEIIELAQKHGVEGIAFTYSEPAVWMEYVIDVGKLAKQAGLYTVYVSNSFVTNEALEEVAPYIDVLCSDIKSLSAAPTRFVPVLKRII